MKEKGLKLADELAMKIFHGEHTDWLVNDAVYMIRKLVAELEERTNENTDLRVMIASKFAELDKQGEPVAWLYERPNGAKKIAWVREPHDKSILKEIPLYTAPQTKPLSDEEIKEIIVQHIQTWNSLDSIIEFARAIEERHGIK